MNIPKAIPELEKKLLQFSEVVSLLYKEIQALETVCLKCLHCPNYHLVITNGSYFLLYLKEKIFEITFQQPNSQ